MLSQSVGYAATALGVVAASTRPLLVREIAAACSIPAPYLGKIIHTLARKGILNTQRGIGGGVSLSEGARDVTLYEIAQAFEDPIVKERCMLGNSECSDERACPCHEFWVAARRRQIEFLKKTKLQDMAKFHLRQLDKGSTRK